MLWNKVEKKLIKRFFSHAINYDYNYKTILNEINFHSSNNNKQKNMNKWVLSFSFSGHSVCVLICVKSNRKKFFYKIKNRSRMDYRRSGSCISILWNKHKGIDFYFCCRIVLTSHELNFFYSFYSAWVELRNYSNVSKDFISISHSVRTMILFPQKY